MIKTNKKTHKYKLAGKTYLVIFTILVIAVSFMWVSGKFFTNFEKNEIQKITLKSDLPTSTTQFNVPITNYATDPTTNNKTQIDNLKTFLAIIDIQQALNNNRPYILPLEIAESGIDMTNPDLKQATDILKLHANKGLTSFDQLILDLHILKSIPNIPEKNWIKRFIIINKMNDTKDTNITNAIEEALLKHNYGEAITLITQYDNQDNTWLQWADKLKSTIAAYNSVIILMNYYKNLLYQM